MRHSETAVPAGLTFVVAAVNRSRAGLQRNVMQLAASKVAAVIDRCRRRPLLLK